MKFLIFYCTLFFTIISTDKGINFQSYSLEKALDTAKSENKLVFIDFYTDWCAPCRFMEKNVFPQAYVGDFYNDNFISLRVNAEKKEGIDLANKFNISVYPTLLYINDEGEVLYRRCGGESTAEFIELGKRAINPIYSIKAMTKIFNDGNGSKEFLEDYMVVLQDHEEFVQISKVLETYLEKGYIQSTNELFELAEANLYNINSKVFLKLNEIANQQPDNIHAYQITIQRIVNKYLSYYQQFPLSLSEFDNIISTTILSAEVKSNMTKKFKIELSK